MESSVNTNCPDWGVFEQKTDGRIKPLLFSFNSKDVMKLAQEMSLKNSGARYYYFQLKGYFIDNKNINIVNEVEYDSKSN